MKVIITGAFLYETLITLTIHPPATGASGFLGSAVHEAFRQDDKIVVRAFSHSRTGPGLVPLDLLDEAQVKDAFKEFEPDC